MQKNVLYVTRYNFVPEGQSNTLKGCKIYVTDNNSVYDTNKKGICVSCYNADIALFDQFQEVPGSYNLDLDMVATKLGDMPKIVVRSVSKASPK